MPTYLCSVEVDQRQRFISQADKLREMLGASRIIQHTQTQVERIRKRHPRVDLAWDVSGVQWLVSDDLQALAQCAWQIRQKFVEKLGFSATIAIVPVHGSFTSAVAELESKMRTLKDSKGGSDGTPRCPLFAQCHILPELAANRWRPKLWGDPQRRRRALISEDADKRERRSRETFARLFADYDCFRESKNGPPRSLLPTEFAHLVLSTADSYIAFVKADADGMGRLLGQLNWDQLALWLRSKPPEAALKFCRAVDECLQEARKAAVNEVTRGFSPTPESRFPVAPVVAAGEDFWILCRRDLAFRLAMTLMEVFEREAATNWIITQALKVASLEGKEKLTLSCGILFARETFPFEVQLEMAEELVRSAKKKRRELEDRNKQGCLDYHWLQSSARESVKDVREAALAYEDGAKTIRLYTRPWTCQEAKTMLEAAQMLRPLPRRKLMQLERILRYGDGLWELGFEQWKAGLEEDSRKAIEDALGHAGATANDRPAVLSELIQLCEIQRLPEG